MFIIKKYNYPIPIAVFLLYCILSISLGVCETYISSSKLSNEVTIDGKWTKPDEWDDAEKIKVYGRSHIKFHKTLIGLLLIKDDNEFLYIMIDYVGDKTLEDNDSGSIRFDINSDKAKLPQSDDVMIVLEWKAKTFQEKYLEGNGSGWSQVEDIPFKIKMASTNDAENDPYYGSPHLIYEFAIPREMFGIIQEIGFSAGATDWSSVRGQSYNGGNSYGPHPRQISFSNYVHYKKPSTWVNLSFAIPYEKNASIPTETQTTLTSTTTSTKLIQTITPTPNRTSTITTTIEPTKIEKSIENSTITESATSRINGEYSVVGVLAIIVIISSIAFMLKRKK